MSRETPIFIRKSTYKIFMIDQDSPHTSEIRQTLSYQNIEFTPHIHHRNYSNPAIEQFSLPGFEDTFQNVRANALNNISHLRNEVL
jgi:hypothetical protein